MTIRFIGQGYSTAVETSMAQELMSQLANKEYNEFRCLVAFASSAGVYGLTEHVTKAKHLKKVQVVVGIDQNGTSKEALEELLKWGVPCFVYHTRQPNTFHPKIYLFKGKKRSLVIVGSNNLTLNCLTRNVEGALALEFDNTDTDGQGVLAEIETYFAPLLGLGASPDANLHQLTTALIDQLIADYQLTTDAEVKKSYAARKPKTGKSTAAKGTSSAGTLFGSPRMQAVPKGFAIRSGSKAEATDEETAETPETEEADSTTSAVVATAPTVALSRHFSEADRAFVSEMNGPGRPGQFSPIHRIFVDFFGGRFDKADRYRTMVYVNDEAIAAEPKSRKLSYKEKNNPDDTKKGNAFVELGHDTLKPYATPKPVVVFIRTRTGLFYYYEAVEADATYSELRDLIGPANNSPGSRLQRSELTVAQLRRACPSLPFWRMS